MSSNLVSVIMPVYNAAAYVRQAVESAINQEETGEVILVEDGSKDESLETCQNIVMQYPNVRLLQHPHGMNRGAAASRNLGVENSKYEILAFLDADDYYLERRFSSALELLNTHPEIDGTYGMMKMLFMNKAAEQSWLVRTRSTTLKDYMRPKEPYKGKSLHDALLNDRGFFSGNVLTVRKSAFNSVGGYSLIPRREDKVLCHKLAAKCNIVPSSYNTPIAVYRIHGSNRGAHTNLSSLEIKKRELIPWDELWIWSTNNLELELQEKYFQRMYQFLTDVAKEYPRGLRRVYLIGALFHRLFQRNHLFSKQYVRNQLFKLFGMEYQSKWNNINNGTR